MTFFRGVRLWRGQGELHSRLQQLSGTAEPDELARECSKLTNAYILLERGIHCRQRLLWITAAVIYAVLVLALPYATGRLLPRRGDELALACGAILLLVPMLVVTAWPLPRMRREIRARRPVLYTQLEELYTRAFDADLPQAAWYTVWEQHVDYNVEYNMQHVMASSRAGLIRDRLLPLLPPDRLAHWLNVLRSLAFTLCWVSGVASLCLTPAADPAGLMAYLRRVALAGLAASAILGVLWVWRKRALAYTVAANRS